MSDQAQTTIECCPYCKAGIYNMYLIGEHQGNPTKHIQFDCGTTFIAATGGCYKQTPNCAHVAVTALTAERTRLTRERDEAIAERDRLRVHCTISDQCLDEMYGIVSRYAEASARVKRFEDCVENAWGLIANVSEGDWRKQHPEWQQAARDWRDNSFHPLWSEIAARRAAASQPKEANHS